MNIQDKYALTITEAAEYFNIGANKLAELTQQDNNTYTLRVGNKRLIKREALEHYLNNINSI